MNHADLYWVPGIMEVCKNCRPWIFGFVTGVKFIRSNVEKILTLDGKVQGLIVNDVSVP